MNSSCKKESSMRVSCAVAMALSCCISAASAAGPDAADKPFSGTFKFGDTSITLTGIVAADQSIGVTVSGAIAPDQNFSLKGLVIPDKGFSFTGTTPTGQTFSGSFGN
jgi:hypothetical protein